MINHLVKTITVDDFFSREQANQLVAATFNLKYIENEFGKEVSNFNMVPPDANEIFSNVFNTNMDVDHDRSGIFRFPEIFIHFEGFDSMNDWVFAVALQQSTFNIFEHKTGATHAAIKHDFNYRNLFEWDLKVNHVLDPGQGILFRPWLFHSFNAGQIQVFRLREKE